MYLKIVPLQGGGLYGFVFSSHLTVALEELLSQLFIHQLTVIIVTISGGNMRGKRVEYSDFG